MSAELFKEFLEWKAKYGAHGDKPGGSDNQGGDDEPENADGPTHVDSGSSTHDPTPEPSDTSGRSEELDVSAEEYLRSRPRGAKSTAAVKKFRVSSLLFLQNECLY